MSNHIQDAVGGLARVTLGTMGLAVVSILCVAAHLAANGSTGYGAVSSERGGASICSCCAAKMAEASA